MSTYDFDKVLSDYEHDRITVEMTMGHSERHSVIIGGDGYCIKFYWLDIILGKHSGES